MRSRKFLLGAVGALTAAVATFTLNTGTSTVALGSSVAPKALPATVQATASDVAKFNLATDRIFGTPTQRRLAEEYVNQQIDAAMSTCMGKSGFDYGGGTAFKGIEVPAAFAGYDIAAPLGTFNQATMVQNKGELLDGTANPGLAKASDKAAYQRASMGCGKADRPEIMAAVANARPTDRLAYKGDRTKADQLSSASIDFQNAVGLLQQSATAEGLLTGYQSCLAQNGFAATSWKDLYASVASKYHGLLGRPWSEIKSTKQWADAVTYEKKAAAADTTCRGAIRSWMVASMSETVDAILADTRTTELGNSWAEIENNARHDGLN